VPLSIFLVEDEVLIRMMIIDMIDELGHHVVAEAGSVAEATPIAASEKFDLAILDINLRGESILPVARLIEARHMPFLFASGYTATGLPQPFHDRPILRKPFAVKKLDEAIRDLVRQETWESSKDIAACTR
jgi:DNA-binding response OmpR family regulator